MLTGSRRKLDVLVLAMAATLLITCAAAAKTEVTMWTFPIGGNGDSLIYEELILPMFREHHPDIELNIIIKPWANRDEAMLLGYISGAGPDIVYLNPDFFPRFINEGLLEPLDRFYTDEIREEYFESALDAVTFDGQIYGFPILQSLFTYFYNMDMFDMAGLNRNDPPTTWEDVAEHARRLTYRSSEESTSRWGVWMMDSGTTTNMTYNPFLWQAGGDIFSPDGSQVAFDGPEGLEALTYLANFNRDGHWAPGNSFHLGRTGIRLGVGMPTGIEFTQMDLGFDWAPGPVLTHRNRVSYGTLGSYAMFNNSRDKEAAATVLKFFTSTEVMEELISRWGYLGPKRTITPLIYGEHGEWMQVFIENAPYVRHDITHPMVRDVYRVLAPTIDRVIALREPPNSALENAARVANALLADVNQ